MSNIYGGRVYENSSFVFDKVYSNHASLKNADDGVYPLRYVLIKYCDTAFTASEQAEIAITKNPEDLEGDKKLWYDNYVADDRISYDRKVFRKEVKADGSLEYKEFATLNVGAAIEGYQEKNLNLNNGKGAASLQSPTSTADGNYATALGLNGTAYGTYSLAAGGGAVAGNKKDPDGSMSAIALGNTVQATGKYSFASGLSTAASGNGSTAMGWKTESDGWGSFSTGLYTNASRDGQTVVGISNASSGGLFVVGNGADVPDSNKSNAFEVFADGHAELAKTGAGDNAVIRREDLNNRISELVKVVSKESVTVDSDGNVTMPEGVTAEIVILY